MGDQFNTQAKILAGRADFLSRSGVPNRVSRSKVKGVAERFLRRD
jgi:hypothetical protein